MLRHSGCYNVYPSRTEHFTVGVSSGAPQGRGVSGKQAFDLYKSIVSSKAAKSGLVSELSGM